MMPDLIIGLTLLAVGVILFVVGLPKKSGRPPFMESHSAPMLYPPLVLIFLVSGLAEIITALFGAAR
jgi:multisubunit Na+/H+ antiporter MnhC subunit